jgi:hypothetical protein
MTHYNSNTYCTVVISVAEFKIVIFYKTRLKFYMLIHKVVFAIAYEYITYFIVTVLCV